MPNDIRAGHPTSWTTIGTGNRNTLMLHCSLGQASAWTAVSKGLSDQCTMTLVDLPGHGQSGPWDGEGDYHTLCTEVAATFLTEPTDIIGHSFGATLALRLARDFPNYTRSLTLIEPVLFALVFEGDQSLRQVYDHDHNAFFEAFQKGDMPLATERFIELWGGNGWSRMPQHLRTYMIDRIGLVAATNGTLIDDNAGLTAEGVIEAITAPTLVIEAEQTVEIMRHIAKQLGTRLPNVTHKVIEKAGHMVPLSHPETVSDEISRFLAGV